MNIETVKILYYFPDVTLPKVPEKFAYRFAEKFGYTQCAGPEGRGLLCTPLTGIPQYDPDSQNWQQLAGTWIGFAKDFKPDDIMRTDAIGGYSVRLGDGREWLIPVAMLDAPNFSLPKYETLNDSGNWIWRVDDKYEFLSYMAQELYNSIDKDYKFSLDENKLRNICLSAISVNYNITDFECAALKLLTPGAYRGITEALIDIKAATEILEHLDGKKKLSEADGTNSGEPVS